MKRTVGLLALAALAGCPLPQNVPEAPASGTAIPSPRIVFELLTPQETFVDVAKNCASQPAFALSATISDQDQGELDEARWFVDYDKTWNPGLRYVETVSGSSVSQDPHRPLTPFTYPLPDWQGSPSYGTHVVELVVSNGFYPLAGDPAGALPNRTPLPGYETQVFRWVFRYVDTGGRCN